jgi:KDO2-lipid IV(A) lauroyltransferase
MKRRRIGRFIAARATLLFAWLLGRLPLRVARWVTLALGRTAYRILPRVRRTGFSNLDLVYGNTLSRREKAARLKQSIDNMCIVAAEFPSIKRLRGRFLDRHITISGIDKLPRDRGAIIIGAHQANWEWLAPALASKGLKMAAVMRPLADPALNAYVDKTRRAGGFVTIPKDGAAQEVIRYLRDGYHVGIMVDQSPRENGVPVRFLGRECWGTIGPVVLSKKTGAPIFGVFMQRGADGRYEVEILPEIELAEGNLGDTILENCQRCQDVVGGSVERNPGQWLWLHRRWKNQPRLEREWQDRQSKK